MPTTEAPMAASGRPMAQPGTKRAREDDVPIPDGGVVAISASAPRSSGWRLSFGDSPLLSLARQEWLSWHHRRLVGAIGERWPLSGASKSLEACRTEGLLPGLQGLHARFHSSQLRAQVAALDPLLPYAPDAVDKDTVKELVGWGLTARDAETLVSTLGGQMATAARSCSQLRETLSEPLAGSSSGAALLLPAFGTIRLLALPPVIGAAVASHRNDNAREARGREGGGNVVGSAVTASGGGDDAVLLLVYEPDLTAVAKWLAPVRAAAMLPNTPLYGPLNMPLYACTARPDIAAALATAGVQLSPFTAALPLRAGHLAKLAMLYDFTAAGVTRMEDVPLSAAAELPLRASDPVFIHCVFCMLARYETFGGNTGGLQGALPHHVFDALQRQLGVDAECFASPLNCHFPRYCSPFVDTDAPFGSMGSFFDWSPARGAYEANPPFINDSMLAMARRMDELLAAADAKGEALLFFVIVPSWDDAYYFKLLSGSRFSRATGTRLARKAHEYIDGLQHRTVSRTTWDANVDSTCFILASGPAAQALVAQQHASGAMASSALEETMGATAATAFVAVRSALENAFAASALVADPPGRVFQIHPIPPLKLPQGNAAPPSASV